MTENPPPADLCLRAVVPAPLKVAYEALTDPAALRVWLAEYADVDLPGKYEFWGRFAPDGAEPHQRVLHVDERTIRLAWTVEGVETTAQFELAEDDGGTLVTLSQSDLPAFEDVIADRAGARGALQTFWSLAIANLADYLDGRELTPKCDFTSAELHTSVVIDAAPDKVFDSITQPEQFCQWFGAKVDIELMWAAGRHRRVRAGPRQSQVRRVRTGPQGDAAVRRQRDRHLGAGSLRRQDPAHPGAQRIRPRQPAVPGLARLADRPGRAAALPRTAALALDLAPGRDRRGTRGHVQHRPMR